MTRGPGRPAAPLRVVADMTAAIFHVGHVRLLRRIKARWPNCHLTVWLEPDERARALKGRRPLMPFADRREILEACRYVDCVEPSPEDYAAHVDAVDLLVRGDVADPAWIPAFYQSFIAAGKLVVLGRTEGVSSTDLADRLGEL